jgi:hypothetical protein
VNFPVSYPFFKQLTFAPKTLFLMDGLGAFLTAFLLIVLVGPLEEYMGMPQRAIHFLTSIAAAFCVYSFGCFFWVSRRWQAFLRAIAIANLLYGCLTIGLVLFYFPQMTRLGIAYFVLELVVVGILVSVELKTANAPDLTRDHR